MENAPENAGLVVIPTLNEQACIANILGKVLCDPSADKLLIIVADGGSTDGTVDIASQFATNFHNVQVMPNRARLQSAGINLAARQFGATRRWLIRLDAHADYPDTFVSTLMSEAARTGASSIVVAMKSVGASCFQRAAAAAQNSVLGTGGSAHRRDGAEGYVDHGHHALFDMNRFLALGGYDASQSHNEDAEFDCRLAQSGGRIWLTRATNIGYHPRSKPGDLYHQYRNYGRGRATTILRHRLRPKLRQLAPAAVLPALALLVAAPWIPVAALPASLWLIVSLVFGAFLGVRGRDICAAASGIAAIVMHLGWSIGFWEALLDHPATARPSEATIPESPR